MAGAAWTDEAVVAPPGVAQAGPGVAGTMADDTTLPSVEDFVRSVWPGLFRTALLLTGSRAEAEDAVQNALALVVERWDRIGRTDNPAGYSSRVLATQTYRRHRRRRLELDRLLLLRRSERSHRDDSSERLAQREALLDALQQLPPRMRTAVVLRFYGDLTERDTATALGCSTGTVKSQTHKGLARLRDLLGEEWGSTRSVGARGDDRTET